MTRSQTYYLISNLLSLDSSKGHMESIITLLDSPDINWPLFVATGSNHLVRQTIYCRILELKLTEYIPTEILEPLKYVYTLNYQRNTEILKQVVSINALLANYGIVSLYLKSIGNIIDGLYTNIGERIMYDIDLLVPEKQWKTSAEILLENGYLGNKIHDPSKHMMMKHYPTLSKAGETAWVEIHRERVNVIHSKTRLYTGQLYLSHHEINLHTWIISRSTHMDLKRFGAYIKLPFFAITDQKLRTSLFKRLLDKECYGRHLNSYRHI